MGHILISKQTESLMNTIPLNGIERRLPICPSCQDTQFIVSKDLTAIKLRIGHEVRLHCTKCNLEWDMQMETFSKKDR